MSRIVVALDSFKGSIGASAACAALADGWRGERPDDEIVLRPMADGGEGTRDAFAAAAPAACRMPVTVVGPHGRPVEAFWLLLPDRTGVIELASTSGIELLAGALRPWDADTVGFGQAIAAALDHGVERLVLGIGSSASTDGGAGMLTALGARLQESDGEPIGPGLRGLDAIVHVDLVGVRALPPGGAVVLSDVTHPLLGARGAAAVFGPQKGLAAHDIDGADATLARFAGLLPADTAAPGAGAAGGTGFALLAWGARIVPGARAVAELIGLPAAIAHADLVITGEGSFDGQSMHGKAPGEVARSAAAAGVPVALVAGAVTDRGSLDRFTASVALLDLAGSREASLADPTRWLRTAGARLAAYRSQEG